MKYYKNLLSYLKNKDYLVCDFRRFMPMVELPYKLAVIRHDIHLRDIPFAYKSIEIEQEIFSNSISTFFVMWNLPGFTKDEDDYEHSDDAIKAYRDFIYFCQDRRIDVQPHISPLSMYLSTVRPFWSEMSVKDISYLFKENYIHRIQDNCSFIDIVKKDVFEIGIMNEVIISKIKEHFYDWRKITGLIPEGCSAHGASPINMNRVIHNGIILDQKFIVDEKLYGYDTYNTRIKKKLNYLSDNSSPLWMFEYERIHDGRYQILCHPYLWRDEYVESMISNMDDKKREMGYYLYPYLAEQEIVSNISDYLNSGLDINEYNNNNRDKTSIR